MPLHTESRMETVITPRQFMRRSELGVIKRGDGDSGAKKWCFCFLYSQSRFSWIHLATDVSCWLLVFIVKQYYCFISQKYDYVRQTESLLCFRNQSEGRMLCVWIWVCVRNSEVSPKTTEASSDQRATGINYALLWMKPTKYWWGLLKCEVVPLGFLSEGH